MGMARMARTCVGGRAGTEPSRPLAGADVSLEQAVEAHPEGVPAGRERVMLERRIERQPEVVRVAVVVVDEAVVEHPEEPLVVLRRRRRGQRLDEPLDLRIGRLLGENRGVERVLVGKVLEDDRLGHAGGSRDFPGRGAVETALGEQAARACR